MTKPTTPTGKRLCPPLESTNHYRLNKDGTTTPLRDHTRADILAIERQAADAERARLREKQAAFHSLHLSFGEDWHQCEHCGCAHAAWLLADPEPSDD